MTDPYPADADGMTDGSRAGSPHETTEWQGYAQTFNDDTTKAAAATPVADTLDAIAAANRSAAKQGNLVPADNAPGHTSDGHHTFNELYAHRAALTAVLATIGSINGDSWRSKQHHPLDKPMFDGYFIVGLDLPDGQISYHYPLSDWGKFAAVPELEHAPKWDGHTSDDVIDRLGGFVANLRQAIADGTAAAHQAHLAADAAVAQADKGE